MWSNLMQNDLTSIKIEYLKALGCDEIKHSKTTLLEHLMGVRDILQEQGAPEYVQDAGLFHSVYGTTYFKPQVTQNRLIVRELIGEQAEELVWIFCKMPAPRGPKFHEWEDSGMEREFGAKEACEFVKKVDFRASDIKFDEAIKS